MNQKDIDNTYHQIVLLLILFTVFTAVANIVTKKNAILLISSFHALYTAVCSTFMIYLTFDANEKFFETDDWMINNIKYLFDFDINYNYDINANLPAIQTAFGRHILSVTLAYVISDVMINLYVMLKDTKHKFEISMIMHHLCVFVAIYYAITVNKEYYIALALISEFATPFLHLCKQKKHLPKIIFNLSAFLLLFIYFFTRVLNFFFITYTAITHKYWVIAIAMGFLTILNWYWFYILCQKALEMYKVESNEKNDISIKSPLFQLRNKLLKQKQIQTNVSDDDNNKKNV